MAYIQRAEEAEAEEPPIGSRVLAAALSRFSQSSAADARYSDAKRARNLRRRSRTITGQRQAGGTVGDAGASDRRDGERYNYFPSFNLTVQYGLLLRPSRGQQSAHARFARMRARPTRGRLKTESTGGGRARGKRAVAEGRWTRIREDEASARLGRTLRSLLFCSVIRTRLFLVEA